MKKSYILLFPVFFFISSLKIVTAQAVLLDDNHGLSGFPYNGKIFLYSEHDSTLWTSDGTPGGTSQFSTVKSANGNFAILNNKIYFDGLDASHGSELWVTDATTSGTSLVADIWVGTDSSKPDNLFTFDNKLYFTAYTPSLGRELYQYNGSGVPVNITDFNIGSGNSFDEFFLTFSNAGVIFFNATTLTQNSIYVLKSGGTIDKILDLPFGFNPIGYSNVGNTTFFAISDRINEMILYKSDGTSSGTILLKDFNSTYSGLMGTQMISWNNKIFFTAAASELDNELWVTDGTTTQMVADINPNSGSFPNLTNSVVLKNKLVFSAANDTTGTELWMTDGTASGTSILKDINTYDSIGSNPVLFPIISLNLSGNGLNYDRSKTFNGYVFFSADDSTHGQALWKTDGTEVNTVMVKDLNPSGNSVTGPYFYTKEGFIFSGDNGTDGSEPWISDGSESGTTGIVNINLTGDSDPFFLFIWNGDLYLNADNGNETEESEYDFYKLQGPYTSLPVTIIDFNAITTPHNVTLRWSTSSESNTDQFMVTRSTDGKHFTSIGHVRAAGNSTILKNYSFTDADAYQQGKSILYYRLEMKDKDDISYLSKIVTTTLYIQPVVMKFFPNPANNLLKITYSTKVRGNINITDLNGRIIYKSSISPSPNGFLEINLKSWTSGTYLIHLTENGSSVVQKFVKK